MRRLAAFFALTGLAACTVGPDYRPRSATDLGVPDAYSVPAGATAEDLTRWWQRFGDPELARLVEQARVANTDLAQAVGRLRQAREALVQSRASLLPSVSGSAGYSRSEVLRGGTTVITTPSGATQTVTRSAGDNFQLGLDAQYQADLFGGTRRSVEAARAENDAARFDYATVLVSVTSEVARNYVLARGLQAQIANARASLAIQDDNLAIAGFRVQAGLVSSLDAEQARSQRAQTAATIPQLQQQYDAAVARLGVLTGQAPGALRQALAPVQPIPTGPRTVDAGIPADVLRQRPDVRAAERSLAAATARIGVAQAQLYPALAITGSISTNAASLGSIANTITGGLFAGLTQAIFNGGRLRSQVRGAQAAADTALAAYKGTVLTALEDVENALSAYRAAQARQRAFAIALDAANNATILSRSQYRTGLTDFTTLQQQELTLLNARNGLTQAQADQATALVQLYAALGGGWDAAALPTGDPTPSTGAR